ncbi:MAG: tetratricopeptide repeat protein [Candidatus Cloacimonetes bacterium]|nr:tetratricopeptide repeat protein [Candidatus Cloacimonadota bacterium]MCF7814023.1 tetratricopeptide repeat protein [Candidatus Cloacimonadota bacterium]MCF7868073.1 tetratricopeptide repeat protein [Candidatus Cloacimonadota bacterium]MCF7883496.1 tetratricopeptide repeat protein [Candidatus Cloacimonadota bacterium]
MKKTILIIVLFVLTVFLAAIPTRIDSLEHAVNNLKGIEKVIMLNQLSEIYLASSPRKSSELSSEAYDLASDLQDSFASAKSLLMMGKANYRLGNYQPALSNLIKSQKLFSTLNDKRGMADVQLIAGLTQLRLSNFDRALFYLLNTLKLERELGSKKGTLKALNHIADLHYYLQNYDESLKYYKDALALEQQVGSSESISTTLSNLGMVHADRGDFDNALQYYMRSLQIEQKAENSGGVANAYYNLGLLYSKLEDYDRALDYLDQSLNLNLEIGSKYEISNTFLHIGKIYTKLGDKDMAFANLTQGIQIAIDINSRILLRDGYYNLYEYYNEQNDLPHAFQYYKLYANQKELILTETNKKQLQELQTGLQHLDNEKEIELKEKEEVIGRLVSDKRKLFNLLLIFGVVAVTSAAGILYYRFRQESIINKKLKTEIVEKEEIEHKLSNRLAIEKVVSSISSNFIKIKDFNKVIKLSLENIGKVCNASRASLFLISENNKALERTHVWQESGLGMLPPSIKEMEISKNKWWNSKLENDEIVHVDDVSMMPQEAFQEQRFLEQQGVKSALAFAVKFKQRLIGFVSFENFSKTHKWQTEDFALLSLFSETIGLFFERKEMEDRLRNANSLLERRVSERTQELANANQELQLEIAERKRAQQDLNDSYHRLKKAMEETVNALISAVEIRDPYTAGHQLRVATLSREIGLAMGLGKEQLDSIRIAAILHDIGKIYVPTEILTKPARLTETEYSMIKNHPLAGYDILKTIDFELPVAKIVYQHHEKINGSGYPQGLAGNEIMLEAKIVNIADVVDAMISQRPYRNSQGIDEALAELRRNAGLLYDEDIVQVCIDLFNNRGFQFEEIKVRTSPR